jgi:hypothetical protein
MENTAVTVKFETAISKGLLTYAGLAGALGQYAAAVAVFLASDDKVVSLGPLGTATATLLGVIAARASQAKEAIRATSTSGKSFPVGVATSSAQAREQFSVDLGAEEAVEVSTASERDGQDWVD